MAKNRHKKQPVPNRKKTRASKARETTQTQCAKAPVPETGGDRIEYILNALTETDEGQYGLQRERRLWLPEPETPQELLNALVAQGILDSTDRVQAVHTGTRARWVIETRGPLPCPVFVLYTDHPRPWQHAPQHDRGYEIRIDELDGQYQTRMICRDPWEKYRDVIGTPNRDLIGQYVTARDMAMDLEIRGFRVKTTLQIALGG